MEVFDQNRRAYEFWFLIGCDVVQSRDNSHYNGFLLTSRDETSSIPSLSATGLMYLQFKIFSTLKCLIPHGFQRG